MGLEASWGQVALPFVNDSRGGVGRARWPNAPERFGCERGGIAGTSGGGLSQTALPFGQRYEEKDKEQHAHYIR